MFRRMYVIRELPLCVLPSYIKTPAALHHRCTCMCCHLDRAQISRHVISAIARLFYYLHFNVSLIITTDCKDFCHIRMYCVVLRASHDVLDALLYGVYMHQLSVLRIIVGARYYCLYYVFIVCIVYLLLVLCIYCLYLTSDYSLFRCRTAGYRSIAGRSCDRPS
jgi:hypothetical protein